MQAPQERTNYCNAHINPVLCSDRYLVCWIQLKPLPGVPTARALQQEATWPSRPSLLKWVGSQTRAISCAMLEGGCIAFLCVALTTIAGRCGANDHADGRIVYMRYDACDAMQRTR